jgi:hypothetical protein
VSGGESQHHLHPWRCHPRPALHPAPGILLLLLLLLQDEQPSLMAVLVVVEASSATGRLPVLHSWM